MLGNAVERYPRQQGEAHAKARDLLSLAVSVKPGVDADEISGACKEGDSPARRLPATPSKSSNATAAIRAPEANASRARSRLSTDARCRSKHRAAAHSRQSAHKDALADPGTLAMLTDVGLRSVGGDPDKGPNHRAGEGVDLSGGGRVACLDSARAKFMHRLAAFHDRNTVAGTPPQEDGLGFAGS